MSKFSGRAGFLRSADGITGSFLPRMVLSSPFRALRLVLLRPWQGYATIISACPAERGREICAATAPANLIKR